MENGDVSARLLGYGRTKKCSKGPQILAAESRAVHVTCDVLSQELFVISLGRRGLTYSRILGEMESETTETNSSLQRSALPL